MIDLPPEIIEIIFLTLCSPKTIFPLRGDPRLLVTHVCSQWRAIALATPSLWANIHIPLNFPPPYDHVRTWISRSAQSPLSVGSYGPTHHSTPTADIFDLIIPVIQRCVSLRLFLDGITFKRLLALPPGSLYTLQGISINLAHTGRYGMIRFLPHRVTAFQQCPRLRQVSLAFVARAVDLAVFDLPWNQLTQLNISSCLLGEYECLKVLRQCTALRECSISTCFTPLSDLHRIQALSAHPIVMPSLHTLHLNLGDPAGHSIHFVHALRLPRLHSFRSSPPIACILPTFRPFLSETIRHLDVEPPDAGRLIHKVL